VIRLVQVVPRDREPGGVAGYAAVLGRALGERIGIESDFVDGRDPGCLPAEGVLIVHYANYGYQRRGCPAGLVQTLARWRRGHGGRRLVTVFHEVYADGPPWRSSFWTSPIQRRLAGRLARASDGLLTSLPLYVRRIQTVAPEVPVAVTAVFSTVGEPETLPAPEDREPVLMVFGGEGARRRAWNERRPELATACQVLGIERILDIGPFVAGIPERIGGTPVEVLGVLEDVEVSRRLLGATAGFLAYPLEFLPKSTIFGAYCSHGVVPVCTGEIRGLGDPLPPFWSPDSPEDPIEIAATAHHWYREHALERQVEVFLRLLGLAGAAP
jgi:hypothetical protein